VRTYGEVSSKPRHNDGSIPLHTAIVEAALVQRADGRDPIIGLSGADLRGADLSDAYVYQADLSEAEGISNEKLEQQAGFLGGTTMPNGQKYEDWLKDKEG
jgi:uncharacterized protein YjbI with pentapeptide repeats